MTLHTYENLALSGSARQGRYETTHGAFETPAFMPVGTRGSVKGVDCERLKESGAQITLVNTYHLWLRPGEQVVQNLGGIHSFCNWQGPILSDSGGFQVFSLKGIRKISEEGVKFQSHIDGQECFLSPEKSIQIQETLGVDIAMVLDECPAADLTHKEFDTSLQMTLRWAKRSLAAREKTSTAIFGITQGGCFSDLRQRAAEGLQEIDVDGSGFDGYAIGGLSVGEPVSQMYETLSYHVDQLPETHVRYLMGVGYPIDIVEAVFRGVDMFDCVIPTRSGRFGRVFVRGDEPFFNIKNSRFQLDNNPIDSSCKCVACRNYSRGYIHHLFRTGEMLAPQLLSIHNITHYQELMSSIREAISQDRYEELYKAEHSRWEGFKRGDKGKSAA